MWSTHRYFLSSFPPRYFSSLSETRGHISTWPRRLQFVNNLHQNWYSYSGCMHAASIPHTPTSMFRLLVRIASHFHSNVPPPPLQLDAGLTVLAAHSFTRLKNTNLNTNEVHSNCEGHSHVCYKCKQSLRIFCLLMTPKAGRGLVVEDFPWKVWPDVYYDIYNRGVPTYTECRRSFEFFTCWGVPEQDHKSQVAPVCAPKLNHSALKPLQKH